MRVLLCWAMGGRRGVRLYVALFVCPHALEWMRSMDNIKLLYVPTIYIPTYLALSVPEDVLSKSKRK